MSLELSLVSIIHYSEKYENNTQNSYIIIVTELYILTTICA